MPSLIRTISTAFVGLLGSVVLTSGALAQPSELAIAADKDWQHEWTAMTFPARVGNFERESITQFEDRETNISARYFDEDTQTILSLYVYRPSNPSTAIWFDRALISIGAPEAYGSVDLDDIKIGTFTPTGSAAESGQYAVMKVDGNFRSTGVALYRAGEWLVKVRISSRELSISQMDTALRTALSQLPALEGVDPIPAQFVNECETQLEFGAGRAVTSGLGAIALGQAIAVTAEQTAAKGNLDPDEVESLEIGDRGVVSYCRAGERNRQFNVFRPVGTADRYTVGIGDAGFSIEVYPDLVASELNSDGSGETVFTVRSASGLEVSLHTPFLGLPDMRQVSQSAMGGPTIASVNRPLSDDENPSINISSTLN